MFMKQKNRTKIIAVYFRGEEKAKLIHDDIAKYYCAMTL